MTVVIPLGSVGSTGVYGRGPMSASQRRLLGDEIVKLCNLEGPISVRYVYYRCVTGELGIQVPKTDAEYERISEVVCELRDSGELAPALIYDGTRDFNPTPYWENVSPWRGAEVAPLLVCESGSLEGMLRKVAAKFSVGLTSLKGQPSYTLLHTMSEYVNSSDRPVRILYVGDHDKAGYDIPQAMVDFLEKTNQVDFNLVRLAVTEEVIERYGLSRVIPKKPTKDWPTTTEGEALSNAEMEELVSTELLELVPEGALEYSEQLQFALDYHLAKILEWGGLVHAQLIQGATLEELGLE